MMMVHFIGQKLKKNWQIILLILLHTLFAALYINQRDICSDESDYLEYARKWLQGNPERSYALYDSKSPVVIVAWVPRIINQVLNNPIHKNDWGKSDQEIGRYMMILFTLLTSIYIYFWSKKILFPKWNLLPVVLFLFDPLILGHSGMIGTDIACAFSFIAILYHLWKYLNRQNWFDFFACTFYVGFACIVKQNMVLMAGFVPLIVFIHKLLQKELMSFFSLNAILKSISFFLIVLLVINLAFYGHGTFTSLNQYHFQSTFFKNFQSSYTTLSNISLPFPSSFVQGFDLFSYHGQIGGGKPESTYNPVTVLGNESYHNGFWYYYLVNLFFKMPTAIICLSVIGILLLIKKIFIKKQLSILHYCILIPSLIYFIVLSFFNPIKIGVRHLIFLLPTFYILFAQLIEYITVNRNVKIILILLAFIQTISLVKYFNNYIAYTNEFAYDKISILNWLSDGSLDYGQNNSAPKNFIKNNVEYVLPTSIEAAGKYAVRALQVIHVNKSTPDTLAWLRKYHPVDVYKGTVWIYKINR